jgi:hypothetical protein
VPAARETPFNITVTRLTHEGIPVKSMLVPLVDATAVPLVNTPTPVGVPAMTGLVNVCPVALVNTVPLVAGNVNTVVPATAGAVNDTVPEVSPAMTTLDILTLHKSK